MGMIEGGEHTRLAAEPRQPLGVSCEMCRQHLDGDVAVKAAVVGAINLAHAAASGHRHHSIAAEAPAREVGRGGRVDVGGRSAQEFDEARRRHRLIEQRLHFPAQPVVARARLMKKLRAAALAKRAGGVIQLLDPLPA
jgi:hypothetical protein